MVMVPPLSMLQEEKQIPHDIALTAGRLWGIRGWSRTSEECHVMLSRSYIHVYGLGGALED